MELFVLTWWLLLHQLAWVKIIDSPLRIDHALRNDTISNSQTINMFAVCQNHEYKLPNHTCLLEFTLSNDVYKYFQAPKSRLFSVLYEAWHAEFEGVLLEWWMVCLSIKFSSWYLPVRYASSVSGTWLFCTWEFTQTRVTTLRVILTEYFFPV